MLGLALARRRSQWQEQRATKGLSMHYFGDGGRSGLARVNFSIAV